MHPRASQLISHLDLRPHPEGGYYRQVYRSLSRVQPLEEGRPVRPALTTIYFLLTAGEVSRWHRVLSDEVWHLYEGDRLELYSMEPGFSKVNRMLLGPAGDEASPVQVIPAGNWQAARTAGAYTLTGCSVGPGFDFDDFTLLSELDEEAEKVRQHHPDLACLL